MKKIPFLYTMIRGAVGKEFVVKHYKGGRIVITKFPDMSGIVASDKQRVRRDLFREAVVYARWIVGDEGRKKAFRKSLPWKKRRHVYQGAIRLYMRMQGDQQWLRKQLAVKCVKRESARGGHASNVKGSFEQKGPWRVMWQKREHKYWEESRDIAKGKNNDEGWSNGCWRDIRTKAVENAKARANALIKTGLIL